ncbi:phage tail protein [Vibrio alginolyticus]|nr:phage tail protein [Vibrio alginolyticus]
MTQPPENQQQYGSILTILGENAEQNGKLQNKQITFTHMAIGDANDEYVQPDRKQTTLVNELARIPVNSVDVLQPTPDSVPMLKVEAILPDDVNDLVIREFAAVATFDGNTYFHAVGNCARIYVPAPINNGNVSTPVTLEMIFVITSADPIVEIDPNVVTASREYVNKTAAIAFNDVDELIKNSKGIVFKEGMNILLYNHLYKTSITDDGQNIAISNTSPQLYANLIKGQKKFGEVFGGLIYKPETEVELGKVYLNVIDTDVNNGSYLYFDAPDMPVSPVAYSDSYGGSVKDGIFAVTDRTGQDVRSFHGYRAGHKSVTLNACFFGAQAGEMAQDTVTDQWWKGGSAGFGRLALHDSTSANTAAMGNESANHLKGDRGAYVGSFSGNSAEGDDSCGVGFQSCDHNLGHYVNGVGYQSLYQNQGDYCDGLGFGALGNNKGARNAGIGAYVLNNSLGTDNFGAGYRTLSVCHGSFNAAGGIQAAFKSDGSPFAASHVALWGYRAGYNSEGNGLSGVGREVLAGSTGDFLSGLGYLAGVGVTYSRSTCIGQQSTVTGNDQIQLGAPGSSVYAYGPVQDRSDERDKTDFNPISDALKNFLLDVEFQTYRLDYRESYFEYEQVQVGVDDEAQPVFEIRIKPLPKDGSKAGKRHHAGAVAQQVKAAMDKHGVDFAGYQDHSVNGGEDVKSLGYQEFIPIIGALLQDHHKEIESLRNEIELLKKS